MKLPHPHFGGLLFVPVLLFSGCTVGPNYHKPAAPTAPAFKESAVVPPPNLPDGGWKQVSPNDSTLRANWWEIYQDRQLDKLEEQVAVSNQTLKASYEQYMQAREAIQFYRSQYYPTVQVGSSAAFNGQEPGGRTLVPRYGCCNPILVDRANTNCFPGFPLPPNAW